MCECTFPHPQAPPGVTSDPTSPKVGREGGWRYRRSWWDQRGISLPTPRALQQKKEKEKKLVALLRTCPFVLSNQWTLWSLYGPDSVFSALIYWSSVPVAQGSAHKSRANTDHLRSSCGQKISGVSCLLKSSKREAFMLRKDEYPVTIKIGFHFKVRLRRLAFAVHKSFDYVLLYYSFI